MAANLEKIVEDLSALTVLKAAELAKLLEEKWGVSAAAPVAVAAVAGAAAQSRPDHLPCGQSQLPRNRSSKPPGRARRNGPHERLSRSSVWCGAPGRAHRSGLQKRASRV